MTRRFALTATLVVALNGGTTMAEEPAPLAEFDKLWDYNDPATTEERFRDLLPQAYEGGDTSLLVQLLTQVARAQGLQRKFDDAHATLDRAQEL
ncbi:MAG: hypothetical protein GF346_09720, partial [Candidatus Eisenbacteria bacterium]|nr:hypothetical protein [Candidatus Latescibacterota bacterium]MBD3302711.1 hypothetical protein [Candidatus Eisenbacteria bacterium]